jgi:hypothetical protein
MKSQRRFGAKLLIVLVVLGSGCGGTMKTGTAKKPATNKPADDGTCPSEDSVCGSGTFAICVDLQNVANHCGLCHLTLSSAPEVNAIAFSIAVGDLSGDGLPDLVTSANYGQDQLNVFLSDSTGTLHLSNTYATGYAAEITIKDWDKDGRPDIVVQGSTLTILYNRVELPSG